MHAHHRSYSIGDRKSRLLHTASLISGFGMGLPSHQLYERASGCYDVLIDTLENPVLARELSAFSQMPAKEIQASAEAIIDRLLFNRENDPYISLGLKGSVSAAEATRRWKRLIILYHPDRYPNQTKYEERAKKINQAYAEIGRTKEKVVRHEIIRNVRRTSSPPKNRMLFSKYMRRLPTVILTIAVIVAIFAVLLLIVKSRKRFALYIPAERQTVAGIFPAKSHPSMDHLLAYGNRPRSSGQDRSSLTRPHVCSSTSLKSNIWDAADSAFYNCELPHTFFGPS